MWQSLPSQSQKNGKLDDVAFPADENPAPTRPLESLYNDQYPEDTLIQPIIGLATENKATDTKQFLE